jgi:hypothetical protein
MAITISGNGIVEGNLANGAVTNTKLATGIDATKLADGTITNSELQYINSLSSNAQTQINGVGGGKVVNTSWVQISAELTAHDVSTFHHNFQGTITPQSVTNKILCIMHINGLYVAGAGRLDTRMNWDTTSGGTTGANITFTQHGDPSYDVTGSREHLHNVTMVGQFTPGTTSQIYVKSLVYKHDSTTTWYAQRRSASYSSITLIELEY